MATKKKTDKKSSNGSAKTAADARVASRTTSTKVRALANAQTLQAAEPNNQNTRIQILTVVFTILCVLFAVVAYAQYMR